MKKGSGTWSTLARWCGKKRPHLRRAAAVLRGSKITVGLRANLEMMCMQERPEKYEVRALERADGSLEYGE